MHGLTQSEALTAAAQVLSKRLRIAEENPDSISAAADVESARAAYKAAYKVYTNPFGVRKTS